MSRDILILSGYACTAQVWKPVQQILSAQDAAHLNLALVDWPPDLTPGFHTIAGFAHWLANEYPLDTYDLIIGHSLGGLVAARCLVDHPLPETRLVLTESFLRPPGPFFQNLLMPDADPALARQVKEMLAEQRGFYSPLLQQDLRAVDLWASRELPEVPTFALYGDRGCGEPERVTRELNWPDELRARVPVMVIPRACHFPMLENPVEVARVISLLVQR